MSPLKEIERAALKLPDKARLRLVDRLLGSLPAPAALTSREILAEAKRRDAEIENGRVKPLSEAQFWAGVRQR